MVLRETKQRLTLSQGRCLAGQIWDSSLREASPTWAFAEGARGFFTFFLVQNPHAQPVDVTFTFLRGQDTPFETTVTVLPHSRLTLYTGDYAELQDRSFGSRVAATLPIVVERAMHFGNTPEQFWTGVIRPRGELWLSALTKEVSTIPEAAGITRFGETAAAIMSSGPRTLRS